MEKHKGGYKRGWFYWKG